MNAKTLRWDDLEVVLAIARAGSLSGAARTLGVNHSTVFRRLGTIEARLGVRLFERMASGYLPTEAGQQVARAGERMDEEVVGLSRSLIGGDLQLRGRLRVTAPSGLALNRLIPHLSDFGRRYPEIELDLVITNSNLDLKQREADVAIRNTPQPPEAMLGRQVCELAIGIYAAEDYWAAHGHRPLQQQAWLLPGQGLEQIPAARWLEEHYPQVRVAFRCSSLLGLYEAARAGSGLAPLPCYLGDPEPGLRRVLDPLPELSSQLWLLSHPDLRGTARVRVFVDFLHQRLVAERDLFEGRWKSSNGE